MVRVYISSTFSDLEHYRQGVYRTLRRMGHDVVAMEDYVASARRPLEDCLSDVAACELYIGIFAWRYGFIPAAADPEKPDAGNPEQKSITELEYLHATQLGKDRLIFLLHEDAPWPKSKVEDGAGAERLKAFRGRLSDEHTVNFFNDLGDLTTKVSTAVSVWQDERKAGDLPDQSGRKAEGEKPRAPEVNVARLPVTGGLLFGRENELKALDEAWGDGGTHVISFIAWGGVGKSALVNKWLSNLARDDYRGAEKVYAWSFYRQGTGEQGVSADQFIDAALRWFGDPDPTTGTPWDKGERLARLIRKQRTLLLLDGLEPLQFPPGRGHREGALKEHSMQALLRELAAHNPGLCVITSRLAVTDLADSEDVTMRRVNLEHLSPQAGAAVLRNQGVKGEQSELECASEEFGGHALALTLLGSYLANAHDGDIARRDRVDILREDEEQGGHAGRVMASYEKWFGDGPELSVLRILGLFDRPADGASVAALRAAPVIPGLTDSLQDIPEEDWRRTLNRLRAAKLIADRERADRATLDSHPLVREYFKQQLKRDNPDAWRAGNSRLYEHLRDTTKKFPETIEGMAPLYAAVAHGCAANRYQEAFDDVFIARIRRGKATRFSINMLGAFGTDLAALTNFFASPWQQPVLALDEDTRAFLLNSTGFALRALGRSVEAAQPMQASFEARLLQKRWVNAATIASNLTELYINIGDLPQASSYAQRSVELADRSGNSFWRMASRTALAYALYHANRLAEAESLLQEAEEMQKERQPMLPLLYSIQGFICCALLLHQEKYEEVQTRAAETLAWGKNYEGGLFAIALDYLSLGLSYLGQLKRDHTGDFTQITTYVEMATEGLRQSGRLLYLPLGLMARAELHQVKGEFERAQADLDEAMSIATRGGMGLHQADCHLKYAWLCLAQREGEKAREHWMKAGEMIGRMGYHLRDRDVEEIGRALEGV
jgi:tetratricopeptide (TPR) repeat protein